MQMTSRIPVQTQKAEAFNVLASNIWTLADERGLLVEVGVGVKKLASPMRNKPQ